MSNGNNYLKKFMAKATSSDKENVFNILHWKSFKRGYLFVFVDKLQFCKWEIAYEEIDNATLYKFCIFFIPCYVLCIKSKEKVYKFAVNHNRFWNKKIPFDVTIEDLNKQQSVSRKIIDYISVIIILYGIYKVICYYFR